MGNAVKRDYGQSSAWDMPKVPDYPIIILVGGFNPSDKYWSLGMTIPIYYGKS